MFDFKEIKKITRLFFKNNQKKIDNQKKNNNLDLEVIFNELIEERMVGVREAFEKNPDNFDELGQNKKSIW